MARPSTDLQRTVAPFEVISDFQPSGDQPAAIAELTKRINRGDRDVERSGSQRGGAGAV